MIRLIYWCLAVGYAFAYWGFWGGVLNIFLPIAPIVDGIRLLTAAHGGG